VTRLGQQEHWCDNKISFSNEHSHEQEQRVFHAWEHICQ
jgi:hypothetical protein